MKRLVTSAKTVDGVVNAAETQITSIVPILNGLRRVIMDVSAHMKEVSGQHVEVAHDLSCLLLEMIQYLQFDHDKYSELLRRTETEVEKYKDEMYGRVSRGKNWRISSWNMLDASVSALYMLSDVSDIRVTGSTSVATMAFGPPEGGFPNWLKSFLRDAAAAWRLARNSLTSKDRSAYKKSAIASATAEVVKSFVGGINEDLARVSNPKRGSPKARRHTVQSVEWLSNGRPMRLGVPIRLRPTKSRTSFEGVGLSVSEYPEEWSSIARLSGPTMTLAHADGSRASFVLWSSALERAALAWGVAEGWVEAAVGWKVSWEDEERGKVEMTFLTRAKADEEAGDADDENAGRRVSETTVYVPTKRLSDHWVRWFRGSKKMPFEFSKIEVFNLYVASAVPEADGVWWDEELAPEILSAPRGVILPHAIGRWMATDRTEGP